MYLGKRQERLIKLISAIVVFSFALSCIFPKDAFAGRSSAGGGKIAEVEIKDIAISVGISIGSAVAGQVLSSAISTASQMATASQTAQQASQIAEQAKQAQAAAKTAEDAQKAAELAKRASELVRQAEEAAETGKNIVQASRQTTATLSNITNQAKDMGIQVTKASGVVAHTGRTVANLFTSLAPISSGVSSLASLSTVVPTVVSGYNTYVATSQAARTVGMAGSYYEWDPAVTYVVSTVVTGAIAGGLNPEVALAEKLSDPWTASNMLRATAVGSIAGLGTGSGTVVVDKNWGGNKIADNKSPGALALVAGNLTGLAAGCLGRTITNIDTYNKITEAIYEQKSATELAAQDPDVQTFNKNIEMKEEAYKQNVNAMSDSQKTAALTEIRDLQLKKINFISKKFGNTYTYIEITGTVDGKSSYGIKIPDYEFAEKYAGYSPDSFRQVVPGRYAVDRIGPYVGTDVVAGRFARSLFVEPFSSQNLPGLLSDSLSIWAVASLPENKEYLEPLVKSLVSAGTRPVFSGLVNTYGWDLNRVSLLNSKTGVIESDLIYDYSIKVLASNELMADQAERINELSKELKVDNSASAELNRELQDKEQQLSGLNAYVLEEGLVPPMEDMSIDEYQAVRMDKTAEERARLQYEISGLKTKIAQVKEEAFAKYQASFSDSSIGVAVKDKNGFVVKDENGNIRIEKKEFSLIDPAKWASLDDKARLQYAQTKLKEMYGVGQDLTFEQKNERGEKIIQLTENLVSGEVPFSEINRNLAIEQERARVESVMSDTATTQALNNIGVGKQTVFWNNLGRDMRSGLFEAVISGGIGSIFKKNLPESADNPFSQILVPYAANMTSAVVRGVAWNLGWERVTKEWQWQEKWDFVEPKAYSLKPEDKGYNFIEDKLNQKKEGFADELLKWERFKYITGVNEENGLNYHKEKLTWDFSAGEDGKGAYVKDPRWVITLLYPIDETIGKPSLGEAIGRSMEQANLDYLVGAFSFGRPLTRGDNPHEIYGINPENISTAAFMSYLSNLSTLSGKNLIEAFIYQAREANFDAISKNLKGTALQVPYVAQVANMQPERFTNVFTTKQINSPVTNRYSGPEPLVGPPILDGGIETVYIPTGVPGLSSTIQQFGFESAPRGKSTFWAPFANPFYDVRPQTGPSLNFLKKSAAEGSKSTLFFNDQSSSTNLQPKAPTINLPVTTVSIENTPANISGNINDRNAAQEQALRQLGNII